MNRENFNNGKNLFHGNKLKVIEAPEPTNVNWYNLNKNPSRLSTHIKFTVFYYILVSSICTCVFIAVYF